MARNLVDYKISMDDSWFVMGELNYDLFAERKGVIYHWWVLAKASVVTNGLWTPKSP